MNRDGLVIAFELTRKCRFRCVHCRAGADLNGVGQLSTGQCKSILKSIADYRKGLIILTGGEPLERSDIYELAQYCGELGHSSAVATCGYLVTEETIKKLQACGVGAFSLSLDGADATVHDNFRQTPGAFAAVVNAAQVLRKCGARFQINTTITRRNSGQIEKIADFARELGAGCFNAFILVPTGRGKDIAEDTLDAKAYERMLERLLKLKQEQKINLRVTCGPQFARLAVENGQEPGEVKGCLGGKSFGFVSFCGDVQMCGFCDITAGNLVENGFDFRSIWEGSEFLKSVRHLKAYNGKCRDCEYAGLCSGCRARALGLTGDYLGPDPICSYIPRENQNG